MFISHTGHRANIFNCIISIKRLLLVINRESTRVKKIGRIEQHELRFVSIICHTQTYYLDNFYVLHIISKERTELKRLKKKIQNVECGH